MLITKMHGLGNDFIIIDGRGNEDMDYAPLARRICERRVSVGADGLLVIEDSEEADIRMRVINADGSEAEMCGNGIRCFAKYVYDRGLVSRADFCVETLAGIMRPTMNIENDVVRTVRVDMGSPSFEPRRIPIDAESCMDNEITAAGETVRVSSALMGVPHTVVLYEGELSEKRFLALGDAISHHPLFPKGTNVNFARVDDRKTVTVRTWERGAGPTLACGTGSCATVVLLCEKGLLDRAATVKLAVGELFIEYGETVFMTGPAEYVFEGKLF